MLRKPMDETMGSEGPEPIHHISVRECWKLRETRGKTVCVYEDRPGRVGESEDRAPLPGDALFILERQQSGVSSRMRTVKSPDRILFYQHRSTPYMEIVRQFGLLLGSIGPTRGRCEKPHAH